MDNNNKVMISKTINDNDTALVYYSYALMTKLNGNLRYYFMENNFEANEIIDGLWLGSLESSYDKETLQKKNITHVISVLAGYEPPFPNDLNYFVINTLDSQSSDLFKVFDDCAEFITDAFSENGNVLIHCAYGRSRSATIVSAYLVSSYGMDVDNILMLLKSKRQIVEPNPHYMTQLREYYHTKYQV